MASSYDETCPPDLLQGLVRGTSPLVCATFKQKLILGNVTGIATLMNSVNKILRYYNYL